MGWLVERAVSFQQHIYFSMQIHYMIFYKRIEESLVVNDERSVKKVLKYC